METLTAFYLKLSITSIIIYIIVIAALIFIIGAIVKYTVPSERSTLGDSLWILLIAIPGILILFILVLLGFFGGFGLIVKFINWAAGGLLLLVILYFFFSLIKK